MRQLRSRVLLPCSFLCVLACAVACKPTSGIEVHHLKFRGVKQVSDDDLEAVLATHPSSKLPWGKKNYFDRAKFEADLKRIQAFYLDRGFPEARVTGFDVALNKAQDKADITIDVSEGQPTIASKVTFQGFQQLPEARLNALAAQAPLQSGRPLIAQRSTARARRRSTRCATTVTRTRRSRSRSSRPPTRRRWR